MSHVLSEDVSFGGRLKEVLDSDEAYSLLPDGTWMEGGCAFLAQALMPILGPNHSLVMTGRMWEDGVLDHMVIKTPCGNYIDYDGLQTQEELVNKVREEWGIEDVFFGPPDFKLLEENGVVTRQHDVKALRRLLAIELLGEPRFNNRTESGLEY